VAVCACWRTGSSSCRRCTSISLLADRRARQLRPASGRANSDKATICLCDISPEYRLTGRPSVIPTARRLDHGRAATHVCTPYQCYQCRGNSAVMKSKQSDVVDQSPPSSPRAGQKRKIGTFIYR